MTAPWLGLWSVLLFLVAYNTVHLSVRIWLFLQGYREAAGLIGPIRGRQFPVLTKRIRMAGAVLAGMAAGVAVGWALWWAPAPRVVPPLACLAALLLGLWLAPRRPPVFLALAALAIGLLGGLFL